MQIILHIFTKATEKMVVEFGQRVLEHIIGVHLLICSFLYIFSTSNIWSFAPKSRQ